MQKPAEGAGKARAQVNFEQAVAAYNDARYVDAVELLIETNRICPDAKLCCNFARAYEGLGHPNEGRSIARLTDLPWAAGGPWLFG